MGCCTLDSWSLAVLIIRLHPKQISFSYTKKQQKHVSWVGISCTTAKSRKRKFVPLSHRDVRGSGIVTEKSNCKVGTLAGIDFLYQNELTV